MLLSDGTTLDHIDDNEPVCLNCNDHGCAHCEDIPRDTTTHHAELQTTPEFGVTIDWAVGYEWVHGGQPQVGEAHVMGVTYDPNYWTCPHPPIEPYKIEDVEEGSIFDILILRKYGQPTLGERRRAVSLENKEWI